MHQAPRLTGRNNVAPGYRRFPLHPALAPYVQALLVQTDPTTASEESHRVLPAPYAVIGFQWRGRLSAVQANGESRLAPAGVTGLQSGARLFRAERGTHSALAYLSPAGGQALLGCPMSALTDRHVALQDVLGGRMAAAMIDSVQNTISTECFAARVQDCLLQLAGRTTHTVHPAIAEAIRRINQTNGVQRIGALARDLQVGRRQLERLFSTEVGVGPKTYASLVRFEWVAGQLHSQRPVDLALDAGYADQSHLIRNFSELAGITPARFIKINR